jgi:hypothetical protein
MANTKYSNKINISITSKVYHSAKSATIRDIKQSLMHRPSVKKSTLINILSTNVHYFCKLYSGV